MAQIEPNGAAKPGVGIPIVTDFLGREPVE
jgi:hypothetical protein